MKKHVISQCTTKIGPDQRLEATPIDDMMSLHAFYQLFCCFYWVYIVLREVEREESKKYIDVELTAS